ncbi:ATP-binding protein [Dermatophilaceae bacterium Soc4.6]
MIVISPQEAGTGKSHTLIVLWHAAVHAGYTIRYAAAADLVETLYPGLADNSVGKTIETLLRHDVILIDLCRHRDYAEGWGRAVRCPSDLASGE